MTDSKFEFIFSDAFCFIVVKLAINSMSNSLMTSKQAKEILAKIDDESAKAEFIANVIVRIALFHFALDSEWLSFIFS